MNAAVSGISFQVSEKIGWIRLIRPERKNSFTLGMVDAWADFLVRVRTDDAINVVVLTGTGDSFCAGVDLEAFHGEQRSVLQDKTLLSERVHRVALALEDLDKPVIAAVNGVAVGAGMDMALMCDIRVGSDKATLSEGYVRVGLVPGDGGCYFLPRLVGTAKALELMWTGEFVDAEQAREMGLFLHVWAHDEFDQQVEAYAKRLAAGPPVAMRTIKRAMVQGLRHDLRTALDLISSHQAVVQSTEDSKEAYAAFRERRPPRFKGY